MESQEKVLGPYFSPGFRVKTRIRVADPCHFIGIRIQLLNLMNSDYKLKTNPRLIVFSSIQFQVLLTTHV